MSMHTYIGARYVPRFCGDYDNTQSYEPLDVVDNGSGTTYIARIPTPAGTPLTDQTHWFLYGASSGAIVALQNQVNTLINEVDALKTKKYVFIGDSYGNGSGNNNGWIDKLVVMLGLSASDYYSSAVGGSGFAPSGNQYVTHLQTLAAGMTNDEKDAITDVVVLGGANDAGHSVSDMAAYVNAFVAQSEYEFPNAKIHIGMCAGNYATNTIGIQHPRTLEGYLAGSGYSYINNIEFIFHDRSLIGADHIHPTDDGYERLANFVYAYLTGRSMSVAYREQPVMTMTDGTITGTVKSMIDVENNMTSLQFNSLSFEFDNAKNIGIMHAVDTGISINSNLFLGIQDRSTGQAFDLTSRTIVASFYSEYDSAWHNLNAVIAIYNGKLWVANIDEISTGTLELAMRQVKKISINCFGITIPSMYC